jgi:hypothetical protein
VAAALEANAAALGIGTLYSGDELLSAFDGTLDGDRSRRPDIIIQPAPGVIYTTTGVATKKVEHGGLSDENTQVPLVLVGPGVSAGVIEQPVDLRQVAPTILKALGLKPHDLAAVRMEHTHRLPVLVEAAECGGD